MTSTPPASPNILVVDDTPDNLRLLSDILTQQGYEARAVTSGSQALLTARHTPPDLILLDISMPEMNGFDVCRQLKNDEALADVPVIFLTALSDTTEKLEGFSVGGVDYITKPFQVAEVVARIETHLSLRAARVKLKESLERLQSLERLRDEMVHMVVHDMRSPLMTLKTHLFLLEQEVATAASAEVHEDIRQAMFACERLTRMANDLLDVSRLEEGKLPLVLEPCDLRDLAGTVAADLGVLDTERPILVVGDAPVIVPCDADIVRRVLENLVNNAIKHTPPGSPINIGFTDAGGRVRITVHDRGAGIAAPDRPRIFDKHVTHGSSGARHSAGLGLTFCQLAVTAHGGRVGVAPGEPDGSIFWFELPLS